ncbi:MAG TPA: transposase [Urbifossiella sp.]|nr:transposase [Urbifossiella sp.]
MGVGTVAAGIPDEVRHRPKWRLAVDPWRRARRNGVSFDGLTSDEGYGAAVPLLRFLNRAGQRFVAEVRVNFAVREAAGGPSRSTGTDARAGTRHRVAHRTVRASVWRATTAAVWVADRWHARVVAIDEATGEVKYFRTNATAASVARVLAVAFCR